MRVIPKTAKVKIEFFRNVSIADVVIAIAGLGLELLIFFTNLGIAKLFIMVIVLCLFIGLYMPFDGQRFYMMFVNLIKYIFSVKHITTENEGAVNNIKSYMPYKAISKEFIVYEDYYAGVLQIDPREFRLLSGYSQNQIIDVHFGKIIRSISGNTKASIVKIDRKLSLKKYQEFEEEKRKRIKKLFDDGNITQEELLVREQILDDRIAIYERLEQQELKKPFYYLVVYDNDKGTIKEILNNAVSTFLDAGMTSQILQDRELGIFLKYNYTDNFKEEDAYLLSEDEFFDWVLPKSIDFNPKSAFFDGKEVLNYTIKNFPLSVLNAWGYQMFNIEGTRVVMNLEPYEKHKAVRMLDRSLQELASQSEQAFKVSSLIDKRTHIDTLVDVLRMLQNDNEVLFKVTLHFSVFVSNSTAESKKSLKKTIKRIVAEQGFELADNFCRQNNAVISSNISRMDIMEEYARSIHSGSVAAVFPFVLSSVMDDDGIILGSHDGFPVVANFFKRDKDHVNSNMVVMGKSGSGKSFATKTMLTNLAAENSKVFILDPENEYTPLAKNLHGRIIDVGTASQGRINPFHVITTLDADDEESVIDNFAVHLQFLEEFFRVVLPGIDFEALEYLNNLIVELYKSKGIDFESNFAALKAEDYPIFDDLFKLIRSKLNVLTVDYDVRNLRILHNFISKFASGGRDSTLWNGKSTLSIKENFTVFNFQSLLANKNGVIANAQMLLVLKWLDNEIIKNRDFNIKYNNNRKIIVAIDEAHVFIDPKYPIALDFMYQLAKRIRKYNGMQIVITQNIKDFVGTQEIIRKSTAIINACQYSFIFSLAPNDMEDLCVLYDKAGRINTTEQEQIINNERGHAFIITGPSSRNNIEIVASKKTRELFGE